VIGQRRIYDAGRHREQAIGKGENEEHDTRL
jgi:hypothetical protein